MGIDYLEGGVPDVSSTLFLNTMLGISSFFLNVIFYNTSVYILEKIISK
jgi:hypothetical protein